MMKRWLCIISVIGICAVSAFLWCAHTDRRGFAGHTVRWFKGDGIAIQEAQDVAEDLRTSPDLVELQPWAVATVQRFHRGELLTNATPRYSSIAGYHLAASEIPDFIKSRWSRTNDWVEGSLDISVVVSSNSLPDVVMIHWLAYTVVVGPTNFIMPADKLSSCAKAKPGVYVYTCQR